MDAWGKIPTLFLKNPKWDAPLIIELNIKSKITKFLRNHKHSGKTCTRRDFSEDG